jgi:hypothetical protein
VYVDLIITCLLNFTTFNIFYSKIGAAYKGKNINISKTNKISSRVKNVKVLTTANRLFLKSLGFRVKV